MENPEKTSTNHLARLHSKELEEIFINRFEANFKEFQGFGQIYHPLENRFYSASASDRKPIHSNQYQKVIDLMKKNKIFDRNILEEMPLNEISRFELYSRNFFRKKFLKISILTMSLNSLKDLVHSHKPRPLGLLEVEEAIKKLVKERDVFYYIGLLSTSGWNGTVLDQLPKGINWMVGLVENIDSTHWKLIFTDRENWNGLEQVYDPETEKEKIERGKLYICHHPKLRLKGGHILLDKLNDELKLPEYLLVQAIEEAFEKDDQLEVKDVSGKKILRRKRL